MGLMRAETALMTQPIMKKVVMTLEAIRTSARMLITSAGRAMVEPGRSSSRMMATGLNQYFTEG